ncbi:MAG: hypothetical protein LBS80_06875 [Tannerella sp.]|jgi:hypothetical protein|nr:hypothetical protein [Tannerella sp.]
MNDLRKIFNLTLCLTIVFITGCNDLENYSLNPKHQIEFSTDTLLFEAVFSTIGSTTGYFMIYNRNSEALKIDRIKLASGGSTGFRINVDGRQGDEFNDIPVWKNDSLYVMVEVTLEPNSLNIPFGIYDSILFVTNGVTRSIVLCAQGRNANILRGVTFSADTLLEADRPYLVFDSLKIAEGVTLTVSEGVTFYMHTNSKWIIEGTIKLQGTLEHPVTIRGDRMHNFSSSISYDNVSTQWNGMIFRAGSFDNEMVYAMIRNGISGLTFEESTPDRRKMTILNSRIQNMDGNILWSENCRIEAVNTEFSNASEYLMMLVGGVYQFTHCTMANYMSAEMMSNSSSRSIECLTLANSIMYLYEETGHLEKHILPLKQAYFDNCIIDGDINVSSVKQPGGEMIFRTEEGDANGNDENFNYRFNHCLVKTVNLTGERFINVIFAESPFYINHNGWNKETRKYDFVYDFRLDSGAVCIGRADPEVSVLYLYDLLGVSRNTSHGPSIGAYEYVEDTQQMK